MICNKTTNLLTFLSNNYQLLFYYKSHPSDFNGFIQYNNHSASLPITNLTNLTIQYSIFKYPDIPNTISQYLNNSLPIAGPYSGIGNNSEILTLLNNYNSLDTLSTVCDTEQTQYELPNELTPTNLQDTETEFYNTASISRTVVNNITSSFDRIINILRK
jgi:hypothetical protein